MNSSAARVIVVLRQSPDWRALVAAGGHDSTAFDALIGRQSGTTEALIAFWNASFRVGFYEARARMKEIAEASLDTLDGVTIIPLEDCRPPYDTAALYAFTDDDDWFAPDLAPALLGSRAAASDAAVWTSVRFDGAAVPRANDGFCYTNNYCVHGRLMAADPQRAAAVTQHMGAQDALHAPGVDLARLDRALSVTNKHPCSTVTLERARDEGRPLTDLIEPYRRYLRSDRSRDAARAAELGWAVPFMDATSRFFAGL